MMQLVQTTNKVFMFFSIVLLVHGTIGFTMFVFEEAMQTMMFTAFSYKTAEDYDGLSNHIDMMQITQNSAEVWIYSIGWLAPIMWPAYIEYLKTNQAFIDSQKAIVKSKR